MLRGQAKRKISPREKREMTYPVARYFSNDVIEFAFKRNYFDVLSYDSNKNVFRIVECKITNRLTSIGATFGQILTYSALISGNGRNFLNQVRSHEKQLHIPTRALENIFGSKKIPVEFYVAFRKEDVQDKQAFLHWAHEHFLNNKIGIIQVDRGRCKIVEYAQHVQVPLTASYSNLCEAVNDLEDIIRHKNPLPDAHSHIKSGSCRYIQYYFDIRKIHFEVLFSKNRKFVEVGLHIEMGKQRNRKIFKALKKQEKEIRERLPDVEFDPSGYWKRVCERDYSWDGKATSLTDSYLEEIALKLIAYIETLRPMLDEINWGKLLDKITQDQIIMNIIMGDGTKRNIVTSEQILKGVHRLPQFSNYKNIRGHAIYKARQLCKRDDRFRQIGKHKFCYNPRAS